MAWTKTEVFVAGFTAGDGIGSGLHISNDGNWIVLRKDFFSPDRSTFYINQRNASTGNFDAHSTFTHNFVVTLGANHCRQIISADGSMILVGERWGGNLWQGFLYKWNGSSWVQTDSMSITHWGSNPDVPYFAGFVGDGSALVISGRGASFSGLRLVHIPIDGSGVLGAATVSNLSPDTSAISNLTCAVSPNYAGDKVSVFAFNSSSAPRLNVYSGTVPSYSASAAVYAGAGLGCFCLTDDTKLLAALSNYNSVPGFTVVLFDYVAGSWQLTEVLYPGEQVIGGFSSPTKFYSWTAASSTEMGHLYLITGEEPGDWLLDKFDGTDPLSTHVGDSGITWAALSGDPISNYMLTGTGLVQATAPDVASVLKVSALAVQDVDHAMELDVFVYSAIGGWQASLFEVDSALSGSTGYNGIEVVLFVLGGTFRLALNIRRADTLIYSSMVNTGRSAAYGLQTLRFDVNAARTNVQVKLNGTRYFNETVAALVEPAHNGMVYKAGSDITSIAISRIQGYYPSGTSGGGSGGGGVTLGEGLPDTAGISIFPDLHFLPQPHTREPLPVTKNIEVDVGADRVLRFFSEAPEIQEVALQLLQSEFDTLYAWGETDLSAWTYNFYVELAGPEFASGLEWWLASWVEPPKWKYETGYGYYVSGSLRLLDGPFETRPSLGEFEVEAGVSVTMDANLSVSKSLAAEADVSATVDADLSDTGQTLAAEAAVSASMDASLVIGSTLASEAAVSVDADALLVIQQNLAAEADPSATVDADLRNTASSFRYWKLDITQNNGHGSFLGVGEWELWTGSAGTGTNLVPANNASITFSSVQGDPGTARTNISDGVLTGFSQMLFAFGTLTGWIQIDLGSAQALQSYSVCSAGDSTNIYPNDWTLQGSNDGSTWTTVSTVTDKVFGGSERATYAITYP